VRCADKSSGYFVRPALKGSLAPLRLAILSRCLSVGDRVRPFPLMSVLCAISRQRFSVGCLKPPCSYAPTPQSPRHPSRLPALHQTSSVLPSIVLSTPSSIRFQIEHARQLTPGRSYRAVFASPPRPRDQRRDTAASREMSPEISPGPSVSETERGRASPPSAPTAAAADGGRTPCLPI